MDNTKFKFRGGVTLVELITTMTIASVFVLVVGVLLVAGQRAWEQTYDSAHKRIRQDAVVVMAAFGSMGRKANRLNYIVYDINVGTFTPAVPKGTEPEEVVFGDAVEFRYWDVDLDADDSFELVDVSKTATAYALFYLDGSRLKVDYGQYPPGAVPDGGGARRTSNVSTVLLAGNVSTNSSGAFSHTTLNGIGQGSIRISITLTDPDDGDTAEVRAATLLRNMWPR